jgi:serine/threonine protein kinase
MTSRPSTSVQNPAQSLLGLELDGDWTVVEKMARLPQATGGHFSVSYVVESSDGTKAFLKALDYSAAIQQPDVPRALQNMTTAFNHERDLLYKCAAMSRVVTALADGEVRDAAWAIPVNYLIFEWADRDSRAVVDASHQLDVAWSLRTLHHAAVGLQQLHATGIAHQDVKPSNVLIFHEAGSKLADLGRSSYRSSGGPFDKEDLPPAQPNIPKLPT